MVTADPDAQKLSYAQAIATVRDVARRASQIAVALQALHEPEAARLVTGLAEDAELAARVLGQLLDPAPHETQKYRFHRQRWVLFGEPADLEAMTDHVTHHAQWEDANQPVPPATQAPPSDQARPE
jgi:hypothetical protein